MNKVNEASPATSGSDLERLVMRLSGWKKPTTRIPKDREIVAIRNHDRTRIALGYIIGDTWFVNNIGSVSLDSISEWSYLQPDA